MMINKFKSKLLLFMLVLAGLGIGLMYHPKEQTLPLVAIANYGPHVSLDASIQGIKDALQAQGFIEGKTVRFEIQDVGFDAALIPQMVNTLYHHHPKVMVVMTTPVAQFAKGAIKDIPLVYDVITDPMEASLIQKPNQADGNMTGSSDKQSMDLLLKFAKQILPNAQRVGLLYAPAESNDVALKAALLASATKFHMQVVALPVREARDVSLLMPQFKDQVDFIYVGASGPIQPTLPVIASMSLRMKIPVFNVNEAAVKEGQVLASFGVDYHQVGVHAGELAADILKHPGAHLHAPVFPSQADHHGYISVKYAKALGIEIMPATRAVRVD